jgi:ribosomal protein L34E
MTDHDHNWYGTVCLVCGIENIDAALATVPPATETATSTATVRKCYRHQWFWPAGSESTGESERCAGCGRPRDPIASRRGKSNARLGKDQERRAERRYGWEKIGERGEKTDLRGTFAKVQMKASRRPIPALFRDTFAGLDATKDGRVALLLLSFIEPRGTADFVVIRGADWLALHGEDKPDVG